MCAAELSRTLLPSYATQHLPPSLLISTPRLGPSAPLASPPTPGSIPTLPSSLIVVDVSNNQLSALSPSLPASLDTFLAPFNALAGTIPPLPWTLKGISLEKNQLTGSLPGFQPVPISPAAAAGVRRRLARKLTQEQVAVGQVRVGDRGGEGGHVSVLSQMGFVSHVYGLGMVMDQSLDAG